MTPDAKHGAPAKDETDEDVAEFLRSEPADPTERSDGVWRASVEEGRRR
jgi:hypothetical protein